MISLEIAVNASHGDVYYHRSAKNADGTPMRCRVNGKCKTWKRRPEDFRLPVKRGLYEFGVITRFNAKMWLTETQLGVSFSVGDET